MTQKTAIIPLSGGLDTSAAPLAMNPGHVIGGENYECLVKGGYGRLAGIEATDGRPKPSAAQIVVLGIATAWGAAAVVGATATGSVSAATGVIAYVSGTYLALTKVTGTWVNAENLLVAAVSQGTVILEPSITPLQSNAMYAAAATIYRADIGQVPGSGPICGHCVINDILYAFRNNAGATSQDVYKATTAGWVLVPRLKQIRFNTGTAGAFTGAAVTLSQGGNNATASKIMVESGSWGAGTAAGMIIMSTPAPGVFINGAAGLSTGETLVLVAATYNQVTLFPSGRWEFKPYRFSLTGLNSTPVYGVDRVDLLSGRGGNFIEFDGSVIAPLTAGGIDGPYHLECHKNQLFVIHRQVSLQHSAIGDPYNWTVISGAAELLVGEEVTDLVSMQGNQTDGSMFILCRNRTEVLYGNDSADWNKVLLSKEVGAKPYSSQVVGDLVAYDEQGIRKFSTTQKFGNFAFDTLTDHIQRKASGLTPTASAIDRDGGHYRIFFDDGTWLSGLPGKQWSWMFCRYPFTVHVASEWEIAGVSSIFVSSDANDGWVYECDKGRSFNGEEIGAWFKTAYAHCGSSTMRKAFHSIGIEVRGDSVGVLGVQPDYSYGTTSVNSLAAALASNNPVLPPNSSFDLGAWDNGSWDSEYISVLRVRSPGVGENIATLVYSQSATELKHEATSLTHYYSDRRQRRG